MTVPAKRAIIFNGPPNSGKDQAVQFLVDHFKEIKTERANPMMFKSKLFELTLSIFNVIEEEFFSLYNDRSTKDEPTCLLRGHSPRSAMIFVSETVIKPAMGRNYFGEIAAENLELGCINAFSDGGFIEELQPVYDECDGNVAIVRIHRPECDYSNDSRGYLNGYKNAHIFDIHNDASLEEFKEQVLCVTGIANNIFIHGGES